MGLQQSCLSDEEDLFYNLYLESLIFLTPLSGAPICDSTALVGEGCCIMVLGSFIVAHCSFMCTLPLCLEIFAGEVW